MLLLLIVRREGKGHSAAIDVYGSHGRMDILSRYLYPARNIAFWLLLTDLWEASIVPDLFLQFFFNKRSGCLDVVVSGDGSLKFPGDQWAGMHKDVEVNMYQMKACDAVGTDAKEMEVDEWEIVGD